MPGCSAGITNCLTVQHVIALQRTVFYREKAAGMYHVLPYAAAMQLVELPYLIIQAVVYSAIVHWMASSSAAGLAPSLTAGVLMQGLLLKTYTAGVV